MPRRRGAGQLLFDHAPWSGLWERCWFSAPFLFTATLDVSFPVVAECSNISYDSVGSTSSSLLDRVKVRDEAAWRRLVSVYGHLVLYWCRCAGIRREDRVDVCQDVFRAVAVNIDSFRHDQPGDTFRGWLRTITRNKVADHFRRQNRQPDAIGGSVAHERLWQSPMATPAAPRKQGTRKRPFSSIERLI